MPVIAVITFAVALAAGDAGVDLNAQAERLYSDDFKVRSAAAAELLRAGASGFEAIRKAGERCQEALESAEDWKSVTPKSCANRPQVVWYALTAANQLAKGEPRYRCPRP